MGILRFLLAVSVFISHSGRDLFKMTLLNQAVAVIFFFIVSGFYMSLVINERYPGNTSGFYLNRLLRIFPAYFVVLALVVAVYWAVGLPTIFMVPDPSLGTTERDAYLLLNLAIFGQDIASTYSQQFNSARSIVVDFVSDQPIRIAPNYPVSIAWSVGAELLFYAAAPLLLAFRRANAAFAAILFLASLAWRLHCETSPGDAIGSLVELGLSTDAANLTVAAFPGRYRLFPAVVSLFLLGHFAHAAYAALRKFRWFAAAAKSVTAASAAGLVASLALTGGLPYLDSAAIDGTRLWASYVAFAMLLPFLFEATRNWAFDRQLGALTYPFFLVHAAVLVLLLGRFGPELAFAVTFALSMLVHVAVERPIERLRARIASAHAVSV
ncbi:MAG: acyltransferase [Proteobacteria bacterium]|nr:acyltransferase [Pseudomonadota bacterium]